MKFPRIEKEETAPVVIRHYIQALCILFAVCNMRSNLVSLGKNHGGH